MTESEKRHFCGEGFSLLGHGYDQDAYILAGVISDAVERLRYPPNGDYPQSLQDAMHHLEEYALAKDREVALMRIRSERIFANGGMRLSYANSSKVYDLFLRFDLYRLSPNFKSASLNQRISGARAASVRIHPPKPKGFWGSIFG